MADEQEYVQTLRFPDGCPSFDEKGRYDRKTSGELLNQALALFIQKAIMCGMQLFLAIRKYMQHNEEHAFRVCRMVEGMADSTVEAEQMLYNMVKEEVENK